jgi:hypothetical protein
MATFNYIARGGQTFEQEKGFLWIGRGGIRLERTAAAGGLSIPIAAYHYNHNTGSKL